MTEKWDKRFLALAEHIAEWSKDPSTCVGAVIVDEKRRIASTGYNGFPRGVKDLEERYLDRSKKYPRVVHAEANAILTSRGSVENCTLYTSLLTCCECAKLVIQSGIKRVVAPNAFDGKWWESNQIAMEMYEEAGVEVTLV